MTGGPDSSGPRKWVATRSRSPSESTSGISPQAWSAASVSMTCVTNIPGEDCSIPMAEGNPGSSTTRQFARKNPSRNARCTLTLISKRIA